MSKQKIQTEKQMLDAIAKCRSYFEAARYLDVTYPTFKKWGKHFGIFKKGGMNQGGRGIPRMTKNGRRELKDILNGDYNGKQLNICRFKDWIISEIILEEKCDQCGFSEKRITDGRAPLLLAFNDGDKTNYKLENLRLLCYNCTFLTVGNVAGRRKEYLYDPHTGDIVDEVNMWKATESFRKKERDLWTPERKAKHAEMMREVGKKNKNGHRQIKETVFD